MEPLHRGSRRSILYGAVAAASAAEAGRRGAEYVDRILRGARPADLPIELPTRYEFVLNMRTARALGLTFSRDFLAQVDEVIEP